MTHRLALLASFAALAATLSACSTTRTPNSGDDAAPACGAAPADKCIARRGCSAPQLVAMQCDASTRSWRCPTGARPYARAAAGGASCRPFYSGASQRAVHGGVSLQTADGRCLWLFGGSDGGTHETHPVAVVPDDLAPGSCPSGSLMSGGAGALHDGIDLGKVGSDKLVSLLHSVRVDGRSFVYYRLYTWDSSAIFGVRGLGVGVAPFDEPSARLRIESPLLWPAARDFGDAVASDNGWLYLTGCGRTSGLVGDCHLARVEAGANLADTASYQYYAGAGQWTRPGDTSSARATLFSSGPERSVVRAHGGGYVHLFIAGFGDTIEVRRAPRIEGPWTTARALVRCDLPKDDPDAYCAEPMLHPELSDPMRPDELVVTHNVRTLAKDQAQRRARSPELYTMRLVRARL